MTPPLPTSYPPWNRRSAALGHRMSSGRTRDHNLPLRYLMISLESGDFGISLQLLRILRVMARRRPPSSPWRRSFVQHGRVYSWTQWSWPGPSSIETRHHGRTDCHLHRSSSGIPFRTLSQPTTVHFAPEWQRSATEADERAMSTQEQVENYYNLHTRRLPDIVVGSNVAVQNHRSKNWDIYGVVTEVGSNRRYHIRTGSGRILVRNRRFIRRRVPVLPPGQGDSTRNTSPPPSGPPPPNPPPLRCSTRPQNRPRRLMEEITF